MTHGVVLATELTKRYRGKQTPAVDDVSFEIAEGETIGILGPNGAGKTTLIKMICGVTAPTSGRILVFGADPIREPVLAKNGIGAMHQTGPFDEMLTAQDNLQIAARFRGLAWREAKPWALEIVEYLGLTKALSQLVFQLSGGQRQRLQLVRALLTIPRLLILDEPSAGLDVAGRHQIEGFVLWLREKYGVTVLWSSHYIEELERNSQRVLVIDHGRVLRFAQPRDLVREFGGSHLVVSVEDVAAVDGVLNWFRATGFTATKDGSRVSIESAVANDVLPALSRYCQDTGIAITGLSTVTDSLENVFLRMTAPEGAAA